RPWGGRGFVAAAAARVIINHKNCTSGCIAKSAQAVRDIRAKWAAHPTHLNAIAQGECKMLEICVHKEMARSPRQPTRNRAFARSILLLGSLISSASALAASYVTVSPGGLTTLAGR